MIEIRPFQPDEHALLKRVRLAALRDAPGAFSARLASETTFPDEYWQTLVRGEGRFAGSRSFLARIDGEPVGMAGCCPESAERYRLVAMWVSPSARGRGVGAAVVAQAEAWAASRGASSLVVAVFEGNAGAIEFYRKAGFAASSEGAPRLDIGGLRELQFVKRLAPRPVPSAARPE